MPDWSDDQVLHYFRKHGVVLSSDDLSTIQAQVAGHGDLVRLLCEESLAAGQAPTRWIETAGAGKFRSYLQTLLLNQFPDEHHLKSLCRLLREPLAAIPPDHALAFENAYLFKYDSGSGYSVRYPAYLSYLQELCRHH